MLWKVEEPWWQYTTGTRVLQVCVQFVQYNVLQLLYVRSVGTYTICTLLFTYFKIKICRCLHYTWHLYSTLYRSFWCMYYLNHSDLYSVQFAPFCNISLLFVVILWYNKVLLHGGILMKIVVNLECSLTKLTYLIFSDNKGWVIS